jgi:hypothetical protein
MPRSGSSEGWGQLERRGAESQLDSDEIMRRLLKAGVDFVVIGGLAVAVHGYVRATKDIDIVPKPTPENRETLERTLIDINARPIEETDIRPEEMPVHWGPGALGRGGNWALETDCGRIDILQYLEGVQVVESYTELREQAFNVDVPEVGFVRFASYPHLKLMKTVASRPQDIADLSQLENIRSAE